MSEFDGIIHKDKGSDYGVSFPDFPGCFTAGGTLPARPLTLDQAKKHPLAKGAEVFFVVEAELPVKARCINITPDERLIEQIDHVTTNRSGFLAEAARKKLRHC